VDAVQIVQFVQSTIENRRQSVLDVLENSGISSMEQYQSCMGELNALSYVHQELSDLLKKQEQKDDSWS
jgi:hypothetical protein